MRSSFNRKASRIIMALSCMALVAQTAAAQARSAGGSFGMGYTDVGPVIGLGNLGNANVSFGGRLEHAVKALPDLANGILGIQAAFDYYSYTAISVTFIGATVNYHFKLDEPKLDPFFGLGLGYRIYSCDLANCGGFDSDIRLIARAGARYFFSPRMAFYGDIGAGAATLNLGLMFKLN
jgi:hypothetical protein